MNEKELNAFAQKVTAKVLVVMMQNAPTITSTIDRMNRTAWAEVVKEMGLEVADLMRDVVPLKD